MRTRRNKRWKLAAWMVAGLWAALGAAAEPTKSERGRQLWSRDFADGQLGMLAMNVAGGKSEVVEAGGRKLAKVAASPLSPVPGTYADEVVYEFSVPLATLGLTPQPGLKLLGDLGVLRGNGIETTARVYWHNNTTTFVSDIPGEVERSPGLWGWLEMEKRIDNPGH